MATKIRRVDYFRCTVHDEPGEAYRLLALLADQGVPLLAFTAIPIGPAHTQLTLFPDQNGKLEYEARGAGLKLDGPYPAILVQGDDHPGVLADVHQILLDEGINVYASHAVTDGKGDFGYIVYIRAGDFERAEKVLRI